MSDVTLNVEGLEKLAKALKTSNIPRARVGILGDKVAPHPSKEGSSADAPTNSLIGAVHEYGSISQGIPQRSFLRVPIADNLQKSMESSGAFDYDTISNVLKQGSVKPWLKKIAVLAASISVDAFATAGFGKWAPWKNPYYKNNTGQILVDTQQLRNSITEDVRG